MRRPPFVFGVEQTTNRNRQRQLDGVKRMRCIPWYSTYSTTVGQLIGHFWKRSSDRINDSWICIFRSTE